jgi:PAS domain S-box-containing protein
LNPVAERLRGWSTGVAAGRPVGDIFKIINEHSRNTVESPIDRVLREGVVLGLANHTVLIARDGTETPIEDSAAPILDANREIRGVVLVFRDASTARAVERALRAADERKNEFLAVLAHELRNPLAPIRQAAAIASSKSASPAQIAWSTEVIERQVGHMARLLDDLLDVSRITRGTLDIRRTAITVANAVDAATEMARPLIEARQHRLVIEMPPEPLWIEADALRLAQVIGNLLTNAAKFTPPGGQITLSATAHEHAVEIRVSDTGIGLPRDAIDRIFDMFVQIGPALQRAEGGLGIGLALAKGLVELHGGSIRAESAGPDRGTTITVTLPHGAPAGGDATVAAVSTPAPTPRGTTVVVADDNRDAAESLAMLLRLQGHEVTTAHTGSDALAAIQRVRPRLALLDIGMPDMTGYEVATAVRGASWGKSVKLVALTGWGQEADRARALEAGFDDHWVKPVDPALAAGYCADVASAGRS